VTNRHHLSIDVEEYFQASALDTVFPRGQWGGLPRRSPGLVEELLDLLSEAQALGTFFILGWIGEHEPATVKAIAARGHEVACHGWDHVRGTEFTPDGFREDVRRSKTVLEDLVGQAVVGYRAPSFSITPEAEWALDVLLEAGFRYDSSLFPVRLHPTYGFPGGGRDPYLISRPGGMLAEIPPATLKLGSLILPAAGGAYLRFFPGRILWAALEGANRRGAPGTVYIHPWEFDREMPELPASWLTRLRMTGGIGSMPGKLASLLSRFRFQTMWETARAVLGEQGEEGT
jgi:polysaccharide deacetylase family protein (PEP-CTERM system associated)